MSFCAFAIKKILPLPSFIMLSFYTCGLNIQSKCSQNRDYKLWVMLQVSVMSLGTETTIQTEVPLEKSKNHLNNSVIHIQGLSLQSP